MTELLIGMGVILGGCGVCGGHSAPGECESCSPPTRESD